MRTWLCVPMATFLKVLGKHMDWGIGTKYGAPTAAGALPALIRKGQEYQDFLSTFFSQQPPWHSVSLQKETGSTNRSQDNPSARSLHFSGFPLWSSAGCTDKCWYSSPKHWDTAPNTKNPAKTQLEAELGSAECSSSGHGHTEGCTSCRDFREGH